MKDIYTALTNQYKESGSGGRAADARILAAAEDSAYYYALSPDRENAAGVFPWNGSMKVLAAGAGYGGFVPLCDRVRRLDIADPSEEKLELVRLRFPEAAQSGRLGLITWIEDNDYDAVIADLAGTGPVREYGRDTEGYIRHLCRALKPGGVLVLIAENSGALRYAAGDEPEEPSAFLSIEQIRALRDMCGFSGLKLYYPLPDAVNPVNIYSDSALPGAGSFRDIFDFTRGERTAVFDEDVVYGCLVRAGAFEAFAPAYIAVFTGYGRTEGAEPDTVLPDYVRYNRRRAEEYAQKTEIFFDRDSGSGPERTGIVRKSALTPAANPHIESFETKYKLITKGDSDRTEKATDTAGGKTVLKVVPPRPGTDAAGLKYADFEYIHGTELGRLLAGQIREGQAPEQEIRDALGIILGDGGSCRNLDALFENILVAEDGTYNLIDYEWVSEEEPLDAGYVRWRILYYWYTAHRGALHAYSGPEEFLETFGIGQSEADGYKTLEAAFQERVRGGISYDRFRSERTAPADIKDLRQRLSEFTEWNLRLQDEVEEHKAALSKERETERLSQNHIRNIEKMLADRNRELELLSARNGYLEKHQSLPSRLARKLIGALDAWAPAESRRRRMIHYIKNTVLHPVKQCRLYFTAAGRKYIAGEFRIGGEFTEGGVLQLPQAEEPLVSIVIPAYNQVAYTYACIRSVIANTDPEETPYEVILADDMSTDGTVELGSFIGGLVISRTGENTGFLKNCNQAAAKARGRYIFFLNNDTKVHEGWLSSLVRLMETDETIGMTGSKLVYPDGRLQEAGGIIWSDASGWNYGRLDDPDKPEYSYVKEVDYISGAAIMIRAGLWREIGGFDERFAPAYCEDSDLAFEVRRHGKRVVYQPLSVVTHFEGISNGTDVQGTGLKRYQLVNQQKFKEKWAAELKKQQVNTGNPDPFTARDRSAGRPCVAVIDHYVPTWDRDAGSKTTYQYIKMFLKKGFNVKFIGDNFLHEEPYSTELMQLGVEILYGPEYRDDIYGYLRKNSGNIDFCYLNRPHIAVKYIDFLKKNTGIKCIFYGHDLHYMRIRREYELTGEMRKKRESDYWRSVEYSVMEQADMVYYPSQSEIDEIHRFRPEIPAKAITAYVWDTFRDSADSGCEAFEKREGMLFVGGFKHPPNADAVRWFAESVWPSVRKELPEAVFYVAGSGADEEILALGNADNGIEILGFVSDERLQELYDTTRLTVVPLRYGAGVKGKVVEAIYNNSAIVTTSVGAEGIPDADRVMVVADGETDPAAAEAGTDAGAFADAIVSLYRDSERCAALSAACAAFIREHYSTDAAWEVIADDFRR